MEKKQTALDWYIEQNFNNIVQRETQQISQDEYVIAYNNLLNQAKAMEKEQMIEFATDTHNLNYYKNKSFRKETEDYYNETYGGAE
jgi:succinylglutamate desuccinylase